MMPEGQRSLAVDSFTSRWFNREKLFQLEDKKENLEFELRCFTDPDLIEAFKEIDKL